MMLLSVSSIQEDPCYPLQQACMNAALKAKDSAGEKAIYDSCSRAMFYCNETAQVATRTAALLAGVAAAAIAGVVTWAIVHRDE